MLHMPGFGASRPLEVPLLIAATGPKGPAVAKELADGVFSVITPHREAASFSWCALLSFGTVFDDGEDLASRGWQRLSARGRQCSITPPIPKGALKPSILFPVGEPGVSRSRRSPRPHGTSPFTPVILSSQTSEIAATSKI
jgi:hypothetical protein